MTPTTFFRTNFFLRVAGLGLLGAFSLACVTINVYFPEEAVKDLSVKIEDAVAREAAEAAAGQGGGTGGGGGALISWVDRAAGWVLAALPAAEAHAQEVADPGITNPAIRKIIESRAARVGEIGKYKAQGVLGESNQALLEARDLQAASLADRANIQRLVRDENADRERMFKEIAAATGADPKSLDQIRSTYAETLRQKAKPGEWVQQANGTWQQM